MHQHDKSALKQLQQRAGTSVLSVFALARRLIPSKLRADSVTLMRAENVILSFMLALVLVPFYGAVYWWLGDKTIAFYCFGAMVPIFISPFLLRTRGGIGWARESFNVTIFLLLLAISWRAGGASAAAVIWFAICPVLGLMAGGVWSGAFWGMASLAAVIGLYAAQRLGVALPPVQVRDLPLLYAISSVSLVITIFIDYLIYERINSRLLASLDDALRVINEMAIKDELTGVFNRRELTRLAEQEKNRVERGGATFCICLMDVDHFKEINDVYGHGAGDQVLRDLVRTVQGETRKSDYFGRYGGEEFLSILLDCGIGEARALADRIRNSIETLDLPCVAGRRVTVSIGVAEYRRGETVSQTVSRADKALYIAKRAGRNCVMVAELGSVVAG